MDDSKSTLSSVLTFDNLQNQPNLFDQNSWFIKKETHFELYWKFDKSWVSVSLQKTFKSILHYKFKQPVIEPMVKVTYFIKIHLFRDQLLCGNFNFSLIQN